MPVGVDVHSFTDDPNAQRNENSILFLARMSPAKNPLLLLDALSELSKKGMPFSASFIGSALPAHETYYQDMIKRAAGYGLSGQVLFAPAVANAETSDLYRRHTYFVNCSPSGMFDKTMFEAAACGAVVIAASEDFAQLIGESAYFDGSVEGLAGSLERIMGMEGTELSRIRERQAAAVAANSLERLGVELAAELR
jgi:glycosyltransferase involved in cell wall biosynthesis